MLKYLAMIDVDGTLMHRDTWNPGARELLAYLSSRGFEIALCSGRPTGSLITLTRDMPEVSFIASNSGASVLARESGDGDAAWEVLGHRTVDPHLVEKAVAVADDAGIETWVYNEREWLVREVTDRVRDEESFVGDVAVVDPVIGREDIGKVLFLVAGRGHAETLRAMDEWEGVGFVMSGSTYADLVPEVATQTKGGDLFLRHLGIGWGDVLAIGDGQNDLGMLTKAGRAIGVAPMGPELLEGAGSEQHRALATDTADALRILREWV
ncbi:MAG: HAD hydrolase family protein [Ancrocorticia sp.]